MSALTRAERMAKVADAVKALRPALKAAMADPANESLWEEVEKHGATVHRQGRLLAGKSKGG